MSMGRRKPVQGELFIDADRLKSPGHPFWDRLNDVLEAHGFDRKVEALCAPFYADEVGRPSIPPGTYFRMILVGYFEGIGSERGIAWRCHDSLSLKAFLGLGPADRVPDHSSLSVIRRRLDLSVFKAVNKLILEILGRSNLLKGRQLALDSTLIQADAAMSSIVRRDTNESYAGFVKRLAKAAGEKVKNRGQQGRFDRKRKGRTTSNKDWESPTDGDARVARMKNGATRLAYKPEHAVDLESGAVVACAIHPADMDDRQTMVETLGELEANLGAMDKSSEGVTIVADKGYHSTETLTSSALGGMTTYIAEPEIPGRRRWTKKHPEAKAIHYANRRRLRTRRGRALMRKRCELAERSFAQIFDRGDMRRTRLRGRENVTKRHLMQVVGYNLAILMRKLLGVGSPRALAAALGRLAALLGHLILAMSGQRRLVGAATRDRRHLHHRHPMTSNQLRRDLRRPSSTPS